jgi:hypothetical protein
MVTSKNKHLVGRNKHWKFTVKGDKLILFNLDICGCCGCEALNESFEAYPFMTTENLKLARIKEGDYPKEVMQKDPITGEKVCSFCLA